LRDGAYAKRLKEDLPKWRQAGWVSEAGALGILDSLPREKHPSFGMAGVVGTIGAVLIGLGVLAFVGANWEAMPRLYRFGLLIAALAIAYIFAGVFLSRGFRVFSEAALLVAGLVFAASIALIGQTYHMAGDFQGALMLWEAGMIGAAVLTGSSVLTMLATIGAGYWLWLATVENQVLPHFESLFVILVGGVIATVLRARYSRIVAILAFGFWIGVTVIAFADRLNLPFAGTMALFATAAMAVWALGVALGARGEESRIGALGIDLQWPALAAMLAALGLEQTITFWGDGSATQSWVLPSFILGVLAVLLAGYAFIRRGVSALEPIAVAVLGVAAVGFALWSPGEDLEARLAGGVIVLVASLWVTNLGQVAEHRGKTLGLFAFGAEVLYLYIVTLGTQIDTALAFLGGGVLFIILAYGLFRLDRRMTRKPPTAPPAPPSPAPPVQQAAPAPSTGATP
jgi:uncharacterized membrane protein